MELHTKVTNINNKYYVRLFEGDNLHSEMACLLKEDIRYCCAELLKWYDKLGGESKMASASRDRHYHGLTPKGKVCYKTMLG